MQVLVSCEITKFEVYVTHTYLLTLARMMSDPVVCADGHTYDRKGIEAWFETNDTSPNTGAQVSKKLVPNWALRQAIERWCKAHQGGARGAGKGKGKKDKGKKGREGRA